MKIIQSIAVFVLLLALSGCGLFNKKVPYYTSTVDLNRHQVSSVIVNDLIGFLKKYYPQAKTTFFVTLDSSAKRYGKRYIDSLRRVGYSVTYEKNKASIPFAYKVDFVTKDSIRVTYNIDDATISKIYLIKDRSLVSLSPFTTRNFDRKLFNNNYRVVGAR